MFGAGVLPPSVLSSLTSMVTTCIRRSAKLCCAGVGLKPYSASGIAFAIPMRPSVLPAQSACRSQVTVVQAGPRCAIALLAVSSTPITPRLTTTRFMNASFECVPADLNVRRYDVTASVSPSS